MTESTSATTLTIAAEELAEARAATDPVAAPPRIRYPSEAARRAVAARPAWTRTRA